MSFKSILRFLASIAQKCAVSAVAVSARKKPAAFDDNTLNYEGAIKDEPLIAPWGKFYVSNTLKDIGSATLQITRGARIAPLFSPVSI
ncbi:hypothetical protein PsAD46_02204 [Pseudovibrio sp. Ad46]|uniref:hypothetical protein n=1 Tax=unclassified Pseudovibrio TaxID=2627060 RepID=UPI0007B17D57|nr:MULTISPECIES: hypothetical protein [unclassified Pseudovibrio]KZK90583.1 hypothetical protein PsAD46_02204 [Pseudovibrio sp. Ad46]KZK98888.1 hypothetical protein PsW74_03477 [Pseudovibrio sp. W74]KZL09381.1 hypothetical protein PsAD14_02442 [Pseudovibrio sp. Ad14]KZL13367.1 hypothetical protein PsAD26_02137 [Pseudovibrio sp. Ad26]